MLGVELGEGSANNWLTLGVQRDHGQTAAVAALFFTAFAARRGRRRGIVAGPVVDRIGRVAIVRITTAIGVVGLLLFILGAAPWLVLLGVLLWSVGVSMGFPLGMSAAAEGGGANPAARVSVVASIGYFANLAGPPAIGLLAERAGLLRCLLAARRVHARRLRRRRRARATAGRPPPSLPSTNGAPHDPRRRGDPHPDRRSARRR